MGRRTITHCFVACVLSSSAQCIDRAWTMCSHLLPRLRGRFQFRTKILILLVFLAAIPCCWVSHEVHEGSRQSQVKTHLTEMGAYVSHYAVPYTSDPLEHMGKWLVAQRDADLADSPRNDWMHRVFGEEFRRPIRVVHHRGPGFTDDELEMLSDFEHLTDLHVIGGDVTDDGVRSIRCMKELEALDLTATKITDNGLNEICNLPKLHSLRLSHTTISDEGIRQLAALSTLKMLSLLDTNVTARGADYFHEHRPDVLLIWSTTAQSPTTSRTHRARQIGRRVLVVF